MAEPREWLADELERLFGETKNSSGLIGSLVYGNMPTVLAALRSPGLDRDGERMREACVPNHVAEALKREARDRTFRQELAESVLKSEREKWLRAGRLAMKGNLAALARQIERTENPIPIQGSGALAHEEKAGC